MERAWQQHNNSWQLVFLQHHFIITTSLKQTFYHRKKYLRHVAKFWQFWVGKFSHLPSVTVRHLSVEFCNIGYIGWRESKNYTHIQKESIKWIFFAVWHISYLSHLPLNASMDDLQKRLLNEHPQWEQSRLNLGVWRTKLIKAATDLSNFGNSCHIRGILMSSRIIDFITLRSVQWQFWEAQA